MKINEKEIASVSSLEPFKRYQYLLKKVADAEKVYTLESLEENWASSEVKGHNLYPIWSAEEFALNCTIDAWSGFNVVETNIKEFMETVLPEIEKEGFLLNAFPVGERTGFVVKPNEFVRDINDELENYE
jgi:hypothetical protein